jgi:hypothetical protein
MICGSLTMIFASTWMPDVIGGSVARIASIVPFPHTPQLDDAKTYRESFSKST